MSTDKKGITSCNGYGTYYLRNGTAIKGTWKDNVLISTPNKLHKFYVMGKKEICKLPKVPMNNIINQLSP